MAGSHSVTKALSLAPCTPLLIQAALASPCVRSHFRRPTYLHAFALPETDVDQGASSTSQMPGSLCSSNSLCTAVCCRLRGWGMLAFMNGSLGGASCHLLPMSAPWMKHLQTVKPQAPGKQIPSQIGSPGAASPADEITSPMCIKPYTLGLKWGRNWGCMWNTVCLILAQSALPEAAVAELPPLCQALRSRGLTVVCQAVT